MTHERPTAHAVATDDAASAAAGRLTERERAILDFERQWWRYAGSKEQAVRDLFDMSGTCLLYTSDAADEYNPV